MDQDQVNAAFLADFQTDVSFVAAGIPESSPEAYGGPIVDIIKNRAAALKDYVTVDMVLFGAKLAFDFAISKVPLTISPELKAQLWDMIDAGIRAIYA